ncbi:preprotein translocase subunit SecG [Candidatus Wolfebacteria bacterium RIFCSPLOWO2_01_FULL_45_19]|uniref:Protein-export membrane protein SecG n=1 Tax=Candidatus Wolfebacteria bacterium RIFCSPLOWO2_01_FULL_45_19 TaxID=1802557 RepID=A0A1F8DS46_9BACT|nr:MAG: Preprotein translocase, SecG subunit [Parcubacteria group bacterium GW2011_GWB1_45_9]OGM90638.1 MAG: preprotein translocase subunit SecG [Candidatus Wolfebacteria bacterium RIFCSPLOWO2_01_FULL_45_19]
MDYLSLAQIITAIILIILVLIQEQSSGLSGVFGGDGGFYQTRRGLERGVFIATAVFAAIFAALAIAKFIF